MSTQLIKITCQNNHLFEAHQSEMDESEAICPVCSGKVRVPFEVGWGVAKKALPIYKKLSDGQLVPVQRGDLVRVKWSDDGHLGAIYHESYRDVSASANGKSRALAKWVKFYEFKPTEKDLRSLEEIKRKENKKISVVVVAIAIARAMLVLMVCGGLGNCLEQRQKEFYRQSSREEVLRKQKYEKDQVEWEKDRASGFKRALNKMNTR